MAVSGEEKRIIVTGVVASVAASAVFVWVGYGAIGGGLSFGVERACAFALALAALTVLFGVVLVGMTRLFVSNADGSRPETGSPLDMNIRFLTNTLEQAVLFSIACAAFALVEPAQAAGLLPAMGCWFVIARAAFFVGYRIHPLARAFGFGATMLPTATLLLYTLFRVFV